MAKKEIVTDNNLSLLKGRFTEEQFKGWQAKYAPRKITVIEVEDKICVLKPIGANEVANYSMMVADPESGLAKATEYLISELWIDGDDEILNDEEYFISAMLQTKSIIELKKSRSYQL